MLSLFLITSIYCVINVNSSNFTYWRYGDGNFTNTLPKGHTLFPTGSIANDATYQFTSSMNQTYFYPLISDKNEIFALTNNHTEYSTLGINIMAPLSLTKFDQVLNIITTLPLIDLPIFQTTALRAMYSYPIYYKNENGEYIIINVAHQTSFESLSFISHLFIINAASMDIIANITSETFDYQEIQSSGYNPINVIIHNERIVDQIIDQREVQSSSYTYNYPTNITAYDLSGNQVWNMNYLDFYPFSKISMIAIHDKIIVSQAGDNNYYLITIDIGTGNIWLRHQLDINFWENAKTNFMLQPVAYPQKNLIIGGYMMVAAGYTRYFDVYRVEISDNLIQSTVQRISISFPGSNNYAVYLAINPVENSLLITNFTYIESSNCSSIEFASYDISKFPFNISSKTQQCMPSVITDQQFYFMDENGKSMIGYYYGSSSDQISFSMVSDSMRLMDREKGFNASNQEWFSRSELEPYPVIGSNGMIYFAGVNSIQAYEMDTAYPSWSPTKAPTIAPTTFFEPIDEEGSTSPWLLVVMNAVILIIVVFLCMMLRRCYIKNRYGDTKQPLKKSTQREGGETMYV